MKGIAGFLVLTSLASACDREQKAEEAPVAEPPKASPGAAAPKAAGLEPAPMELGQKPETVPVAAPTPNVPAEKPKTAAPKTNVGSAERAAAEQPSEPTAALVSGAVVTGEGFKLQMQTKSPQTVGKQGNLLITLTADAPFKCNEKYPYKFKFEPVDGVSFPNEIVRGMKVGKNKSSMSVPFSPQQAGKQSVSGDLSFSVCTDDKCLVEKQRLTVSFDVDAS